MTHTVHDIEVAMSVTDTSGIISVDDYLNPNWPGVNEAVAKMYLNRNFPFVPLAYAGNKLFLCGYSYHGKYLEKIKSYLERYHGDAKIKEVTRFGYRTLTVNPGAETRVMRPELM